MIYTMNMIVVIVKVKYFVHDVNITLIDDDKLIEKLYSFGDKDVVDLTINIGVSLITNLLMMLIQFNEDVFILKIKMLNSIVLIYHMDYLKHHFKLSLNNILLKKKKINK